MVGKEVEHVQNVGYKKGSFYTCDNSGEPEGWLDWYSGKSCSNNTTNVDCPGCIGGKIEASTTCEHGKSGIHYYCKHGDDYTTNYHM